MTRPQLEHILRAAAGITGADTFIVVGSQAILGQFPDAPAELTSSIEADVFATRSEADAELIDGSIGEESPFHRTFGYFAHGVGEETSILPEGWKERLVAVRNANTNGTTGLCLEVHDLAAAKLAAGRGKDLAFVQALIRHNMADVTVLRERLAKCPLDEAARPACDRRLRDVVASAQHS
ncbi:MAG: hypothetical protein IT438_07830 [Phycisphaerales bacterium]|nr:hypothetical protein [Phycisphaerales bacterium]